MKNKINLKSILTVIASGFLFALSVNLFVRPIGIYNGGVVGISQLLANFTENVLHINPGIDLMGIFNLLINIPIFIFAWQKLSRKFVILSLLNIVTQSVSFMLIPIPATPIIGDLFVSILFAAIVGAFGAALSFRVKASSGGLDVIGMYFSQRKRGSIGSIYLVVNVAIYTISAIVYHIEIAIYSLVYSIIYSYAMDKFHDHNIEVSVMVFTKNKDIIHAVTKEIRRGVTHWTGEGAFTSTEMDIFVTIVAQSEVAEIKRLIRSLDPQAFIIITQNLKVDGGFEKRLI